MRTQQAIVTEAKHKSAMEKLEEFIKERKANSKGVEDLGKLEREIHKLVAEVECEMIGEELKKYDIDVPEIEIGGKRYKQVLKSKQRYLCLGGEIEVERSLYRQHLGEKAVSAMEIRAGIIEGIWTPSAAEIGAWTLAHIPASEAEELLKKIGAINPSRSSLDRLVKGVGIKLEAQINEVIEYANALGQVPTQAQTVAVSLDGVMIPIRKEKDKEKSTNYAEASCGTISFYDKEGQRLSTIRMARMPEPGKVTLKEMIEKQILTILDEKPSLRVVAIADGAKDNWTYLDKLLPGACKVLDFYHSAQHLHSALDSAYGQSSPSSLSEAEKLRHILRHDEDGVNKVIEALAHLNKRFPRRRIIARELAFFRKNHLRMLYAKLALESLPIGSGVVEAACKTLVSQRLKCSGMRWRNPGGQAILTLRSLIQSQRFDLGWRLLSSSYVSKVSLPKNVIAFSSRCLSV